MTCRCIGSETYQLVAWVPYLTCFPFLCQENISYLRVSLNPILISGNKRRPTHPYKSSTAQTPRSDEWNDHLPPNFRLAKEGLSRHCCRCRSLAGEFVCVKGAKSWLPYVVTKATVGGIHGFGVFRNWTCWPQKAQKTERLSSVIDVDTE